MITNVGIIFYNKLVQIEVLKRDLTISDI